MASTSFVNLVTLTDAEWFNKTDGVAYAYLTGVAGTDTITATGPVSMTAYAAGQKFHFISAGANTGAVTLNITPSGGAALGAKAVTKNGSTALISGDIASGVAVEVTYDGTRFIVSNVPNKTGGTWTPVITFATPGDLSVAYTTQTGFYTQVGNEVVLNFDILTSTFTHTTASGDFSITGVPLSALRASVGTMRWGGITLAGYTAFVPEINAGASVLTVGASGSGSPSGLVNTTAFPTGGTVKLFGTIVYIV